MAQIKKSRSKNVKSRDFEDVAKGSGTVPVPHVLMGFNAGGAAGQTVMHCHCHVIPRYVGDVKEPRGGITRGCDGEERVLKGG